MTREEYIGEIFEYFPTATELYEDTAGQIWTCKDTAAKQSLEGKFKTIKKKEFLKSITNDTEN